MRSQKCKVESITSAFSALDYFILPPLIIFSGKSVPLQVTRTYLFPIFFLCPASLLSHEGFKAEITGGLKTSAA